MDELINDFIAETRDMLQALSGEIVAWEAAPQDRARLDEIFRFVHTVKGNCGFFDLPRLETLSHAAEGALADVRAGRRSADRALVDAVLAVIDRIGELVEAIESGQSIASADDTQLIAALSEDASAPAAPQAVESIASAPDARRSLRSIRLPVELLDRMMSGVSDAVLARNELARRLRETPGDAAVEAAFERLSACVAEIRDAITRTRMQRIDSLFAGLPRLVRDLSAELGKAVSLDVAGGDVELDREMIEMIRDPLTHIVRNAIDHGIEPEPERIAADKPAAGSLRVRACQSGNQILIEISDDGRGIDGDKLVRRAVASGLLSAQEAERLSAVQKTALIFEAGLSTAGEVTAISGRGVGMDVVRANVERIGGVVDVESTPGKGLRLILRVPLTLTIIPALTITAGGQIYAIPRSAIDEILRGKGEAVRVEQVGGASVASIRGKRMPLVSLQGLMALPENAVEDQIFVVLTPAGADCYVLCVDAVHDHEELVVKPAAPAVMAAGLYAGTTLAHDGRPILLLDPSGMARCAGIRLDQGESRSRVVEAPVEEKKPEISALLFRTFDGSRRAVRLAVVERIEDVDWSQVRHKAGRLRVSIGDRLLPLAGCDVPDGEGRLRILRLTDGASEIAYGFAEVIDILSISGEIHASTGSGEISGVTLIGEEQVEILDPYWLFAAHGAAEAATTRSLVCALPEGDPWMEMILQPILESLGYRVINAGGTDAVDLLIASADSELQPLGTASEILRIRSRPGLAGENDNSVYRYDRAALLEALKTKAKRASDNG